MVTTALDLVGSVLVILAAALFVSTWSIPGAVAVAGGLLLLLSVFIDRKAKKV